jgi:hypothetical protein
MDLIQEIRRAREALRHQENKTSEAGFTLRMAKEQEKKARAELDQLLDELETGESRYTLPGFDRLEMVPPGTNGNGNGPATIPGPINWTERDLDGSLLAALRAKGAHGESGHWELLRETGCSDATILETLGTTWPRRFRFDRDVSAGDRVGRTVRGGPKPAFWYGTVARIDDPPTLDGLALAARVRVVLDLPLAGQKQDAGLEQAPKGPNQSARGDAPSRR